MFKKLAERLNYRVYQLETKLTKGVHGREIDEPTDLVIVSDAHTHTERLVFPAYLAEGFTIQDVIDQKQRKVIRVDYMQIAGEMTMMIDFGDVDTIRPDEEYLLELIEANKEDSK